jgi:hypothetical protein
VGSMDIFHNKMNTPLEFKMLRSSRYILPHSNTCPHVGHLNSAISIVIVKSTPGMDEIGLLSVLKLIIATKGRIKLRNKEIIYLQQKG